MKNTWYVIAIILIIGWAIGFFGLHAGAIIHGLLVAGLVIIILRIFGEKKAL